MEVWNVDLCLVHAVFYNKTLAPDWRWYGNQTYNATTTTTFIAGNVRHASAYTL